MTKVPFSGTIIRIEPGRFGIIRFDNPIGPSSNNYGIISPSTATGGTSLTFENMFVEGARVTGTAKADEHELADVTTVTTSADE